MRRLITILASVLLVIAVAGYVGVSYEIAAGVTKAERKALVDTPAAHALTYQDVTFPSRESGISLSGWYIAEGANKPTIIFVHGIDSQRSAEKSVELASRLSQKGYAVLLFDLRGHGASGDGRISAGFFERRDVLGAYDFVVSRGAPPDRVGLLGFSMGAAIAIMSAADEPKIKAVVADSTFANASELIAQEVDRKTPIKKWQVPVFLPVAKLMAKVLYGIDVSALVPETAVANIGYPIYQVHSQADTRIPVSHGVRVHDAAPKGSGIWLVADSEHVKAYSDHSDEYVDRISSYFAERLGAPVPAFAYLA